MKKIMIIAAAFFFSAAIMAADDKPIDTSRLPESARAFLNANFPGEQILYVTKEDDLILPDYNVSLANGYLVEFFHDGSFEKISSVNGIPSELVPVQIIEFVKVRYPDAFFVEYGLDRRHYEVKLSNRMELKFNKNFYLIEIDD